MKTGTFTAKDGREIAIQGVSPMVLLETTVQVEERLRLEGLPIDPPRYSVQSVSGDLIWHEHNPTTLVVEDNPQETAENRRLWREHEAALRRLEHEKVNIMAAALLIGGLVDFPTMPKGEEYWWRRAMMGLEDPKTPAGRYQAWIMAEYVSDTNDFQALLLAIRGLSMEGVDWARVAAVRSLFPGAVQGDAPGPGEDSERVVDDGQVAPGGAGSA